MSNRPDRERTSIILRAAAQARESRVLPGGEARRSGSESKSGGSSRTPRPQIEGYEILEEVHRGGQGVVYRAVQQGTKRPVALKILLEGEFASETTLRRFEREVELAASLRHPNIVTILESGSFDGRYFCAMEFIDGVRLDEFVRSRQLRIGELLLRFTTICDAVNYAHQHGVIHRDLKPSNILVDAAGEPHVLDFGLAKSQRSSSPHETTVALLSLTGQVVGTLAYMSPEQAAGTAEVDLRTDVYSLGVILYELLAGRTPYSVDGPLGEVLHRIANEDPIPPRSMRAEAPYGRYLDDELSTILLRALEKDPVRRYQTAGDLARDIQLYLTGRPIEAKRASGLYLFRKTLRRYGIQASFVALLLIVMVSALAIYASLYHSEREALQKANSLQVIASQRVEQAKLAEEREREFRREAERASAQALKNAAELRRALTQQTVRRGNLALERADLADARDCFWEAYLATPEDPHARWGLRQYYLQAGEQAAIQIAYLAHGPAAFSPDGRYAVACATADSITARNGQSGALLAWLNAPSDIATLRVYADGTVAAAGRYWAGIWNVARPEQHTLFNGPENPRAAHVENGGQHLVLVDQDKVYSIATASGELLDSTALHSAARSGSNVTTERQSPAAIAVVTGSGVELFTLDGAGRLTQSILHKAEKTRAASFSADGLIWLLGDGLSRRVPDQSAPAEQILPAPSCIGWDLMATDGSIRVFLGDADGRVAEWRNGELENTRRISQGPLDGMVIDAATEQLLTLDDRGILTRWRDGRLADLRTPLEGNPWMACSTAKNGQLFALDEAGAILRVNSAGSTPEIIARLPEGSFTAIDVSTPGAAQIAASDDGVVVVLRVLQKGWLLDTSQREPQPLSSSNPESPILRTALSRDGRGLAVLRASPDEADADLDVYAGLRETAAAPVPTRIGHFARSTIRDIAFLQGCEDLAVARSNGDLDVYRLAALPSDSAIENATAITIAPATHSTLCSLSSPAKSLAVDPNARFLAAPCDDGVLRLLALEDLSETGRVHFESDISTVAFAPGGETLLVCDMSGSVQVFAADSLEELATLPRAKRQSGQTLAAWIGHDQSVAVCGAGGTSVWRMPDVDQRIIEDRPFAVQRQVAQALTSRNLFEAWRIATQPGSEQDNAAREAQRAVLGQALAREYWELPAGWAAQLEGALDATTALRFGLSAYAGGRFQEAHRLLRDYRGLAGSHDGDINRRIADCEYLLDDVPSALQAWEEVSHEPGLTFSQFASLSIKRIIALAAHGQVDMARIVLSELENRPVPPVTGAAVASRASATAREILNEQNGLNPDKGAALAAAHTLELFRGELCRAQGDLRHARVHYQRCTAIAGERWHAAWARFRLKQITPQDF